MDRFDPDHYYYDPDGNKITIDEWARRFESERRIAHDEFGNSALVTMYLGFVDPAITGTGLFGTAHMKKGDIVEVEVYGSKADALLGHQRHADAIRHGFHCDKCRSGKPHDGD